MDCRTSSSLNEVRLGKEKFGGETHVYSVAYADSEIDDVISHANKVIFNSVNQLECFGAKATHLPIGLRVNLGVSHSYFDLADPARPSSRLEEIDLTRIESVMDRISGFMLHCNCENGSVAAFSVLLDRIEIRLSGLLAWLDWVSLGGGIAFTKDGYPIDQLAVRLRACADKFGVQIYLELGDIVIIDTTALEVSVLDIVENSKAVAIVDSAVEAHMLDLLVYRESAAIAPNSRPHSYFIAGKSCLAGDVFGEFSFAKPLVIGDRISLLNAGSAFLNMSVLQACLETGAGLYRHSHSRRARQDLRDAALVWQLRRWQRGIISISSPASISSMSMRAAVGAISPPILIPKSISANSPARCGAGRTASEPPTPCLKSV